MKSVLYSVFVCTGVASLFLVTTCRPTVAAGVSWSMVVLPDTQAYDTPSEALVFNAMTQWVVDNKASRNIQVVVGSGDITNDNTAAQWNIAKTAISTLDNEVPYILPTGNHDYSGGGRGTAYNSYFSLTDNPLNSSSSGIITTLKDSNKLENTYSTFTAPDGRNMLIFSLEFGPRQTVVNWANGIASQAQYQDYTAVLATHAYLEEGPASGGQPTPLRSDWATYGTSRLYNPNNYSLTGGDAADGQELWDGLVKGNGNFEMVLNGHYLDDNDTNTNTDPNGGKLTTAYQASVGTNGNTVHEMVFNAQQQANGGNGYFRLLEFLDDGKTVQVRTYSPTLDVWLTDQHNEFQFELTQAPEPEAGLLLVIGLLGTAVRPRK